MDTMEYVTELKKCVTNCGALLTSLEISFSEVFASKARKPPPDMHSDDETDQEDDFGQPLPPLGGSSQENSPPTKAMRAQEEKKAQESALAKIFDLESLEKTVAPPEAPIPKDVAKDVDPRKAFVKNLTMVAAKLMKAIQPGGDLGGEAQAALDIITKASQLYVDSDPASQTTATLPPSPALAPTKAEVDSIEAPGLFDLPQRKQTTENLGISDPDDINVEEPEALELGLEETLPNDNTPDGDSTERSTVDAGADSKAQSHNPGQLTYKENTNMKDYIRRTRGLRLNHLAIQLIPVKASVLSRAIDLNVLKSITLLNVGPQAAFWAVVMREDKISPLPLCKIHTDNVTSTFLACAAQLTTLTQLCLLERMPKDRGESTAAKTLVSMEHIRQKVLKKHAAHLRILVLRNEASNEWDLSVRAILLLCRRAKKLEELAVSFGIKTMVSLLMDHSFNDFERFSTLRNSTNCSARVSAKHARSRLPARSAYHCVSH